MSTFRLSLDLNRRETFGEVRVAQGDSGGTTVVADILDDGAAADLAGYTARFVMRLPDGVHYFADAAEVDGNAVTYTFGEAQAAAVAGVTDQAYFELSRGGERVSTARFTVRVLRSALDGAAVGENWDNAVERLIAAADGAAEVITAAQLAATAANDAAAVANGAAQSTASAAAAASTAASAAQQAAAAGDAFLSAAGQAEAKRAEAEAARTADEQARAEAEARRSAEWAEIKASVQGSSYRVLGPGEYDPDTKVPTVESPAPNVIYLVPTGNSEGNAYDEWVCVNGSWEVLGPAAPTPEGIPVEDIQGLTDGDTGIVGTKYLNATGLNYLWGRIKAKFAAIVHTHAAGDIVSGTLPVARGGTGSATAEAARTALGAASSEEVATLRDSVSRRVIVAQGVRAASVWPNASQGRVEWQATLDDGTEIQLLLYMDPLGMAVVRRFPGGSWESIRVA